MLLTVVATVRRIVAERFEVDLVTRDLAMLDRELLRQASGLFPLLLGVGWRQGGYGDHLSLRILAEHGKQEGGVVSTGEGENHLPEGTQQRLEARRLLGSLTGPALVCRL
jgi:hypothetical protein